MPQGRFRIVGPLLYKHFGRHHAYRTERLENGRWRRVGLTFFGHCKRLSEKEVLDGIRGPLLLRGPIDVQLWKRAKPAARP